MIMRAVFLATAESEKSCSQLEKRGAVLPRAGGCAGSNREREAIIENKNKKIEL